MSLLVALRLLTILPVPGAGSESAALRARAVIWFPAVGAALGGAVWGLDRLLRLVLDPSVTAAISIAALALLTGFLHLDGLMDSADGGFGHRSRAQRLAIMRDPRVGAFGVLAVCLLLLLKWSALSAAQEPARLIALVAGGAASRWAVVPAMRVFPLARTDGRAAAHSGVRIWQVALAGALAAALLGGLFQAAGVVLLGVGLVVALVLGVFYTRLLGGLTGDVYGAIVELSEAGVWLAAPLLVSWTVFGA